MKKKMKPLFSVIGITAGLALTPLAAQAQREGLYFGGSAGLYDIKENTLDEQDSFWKAFLGAQFSEWFALEASYVDFNRASNQSSSFEADGLGAAAVVSFPIGPKSAVFGKVGQLWWDANANLGGVQTRSDNSDTFWGAGLKFGLSQSVHLRLEYERYDVANVDLDAASVGVQVTF